MITKFKIFENINEGEIGIGDYVILGYTPGSGISQQYANNIGKITNIASMGLKHIEYSHISIIYENNLEPLILIHKSWIKYWSKDKEELEAFLATKKYNL